MKRATKIYAAILKGHSLVSAAIFYIVILLILFLPVLFPPKGTLIFGDDIQKSYHFFRIFQQNEFKSGIMPWWNPYLSSGEPFIANPSVTFWYPPNWLFFILDYRFAYSWIIALHLLLAMVGMYWFCRRFMGHLSAWSAGLTFGLSGFFMGRLWQGHIDIISSAPYVPIVIGSIWNALEQKKPKYVICAAGAYALQMFAGYQTMAYFTAWAIGLVTLLWCFKEKSIKPIILVFCIVLLSGGLASLQLLPAQEFFQRSIRTYSLPYSWVLIGSYTVQSLKQLISPFIFGGPDNYSGPGPNYGELSAYVGVIPLLLAVFVSVFFVLKTIRFIRSFRFQSKEILIVACIVLGIFGLWVSFAKNVPVDLQYVLWKIIPLYKYLRVPSRHLLLFVFSISILSGFGLDTIRNKALKIILICCIVADLVLFSGNFIVLKPDPATRHNKDLVSYLQDNAGLGRILPNFNVGVGTRDALDFDAAMQYKFYSISGYDPAILRNYYDFIVAANGIKNYDVQQSDVQVPYINPSTPYVDFLNIKYIFVPTWLDGVGVVGRKYKVVLEETKKDYWRLYENTSVGPRFFLVQHIALYPDREAVTDSIISQSNNLFDTVTAIQKDVGDVSENDCIVGVKGDVRVDLYESNEIVLTTNTPCHMYLSSSEVYYPGWSATVDGKNTHLFEANLAFRALAVDPGRHTIIMTYHPTIFIIGGSISVGTLLFCLYMLIHKKKNV